MANPILVGDVGRLTTAASVASSDFLIVTNNALGNLEKATAAQIVGGSGGFAIGTSSAPITTTAAGNLTQMYYSSTAASGDNRAVYARTYFGGAAGGEAVRAYGTVNNATVAVGGTVNGLHASLSATGASAVVSGAGHAIRATLDLPTGTNIGGTISVIHADSLIEGTVPTNLAYFGLDNLGTNKVPVLISMTNPDTSNLYITSGTSANSAGDTSKCNAPKVLRCRIAGANVYIPVFTQNT